VIVTDESHPLLAAPHADTTACGPESLLGELNDLALAHDQLSSRSRVLFEQLRKMLGQDRLTHCLLGIQSLALQGDAVGARLLAAFLDANTPGSQLVPRIQEFASTHRYRGFSIDAETASDIHACVWLRQLATVVADCERICGPAPAEFSSRSPRPRDIPPLPLLRRTLLALMPGQRASTPLRPEQRRLLVDLVRLETDAYQERVSHLAGVIDPFRVAAVMRALPLLNRADAEVRDLHRFAGWLEEGNDEAAFRKQVPRYQEVFEDNERPRLISALESDHRLAPLARLHAALLRSPQTARQLAGAMASVLVLAHQLRLAGVRRDALDLLAAAELVLTSSPGGHLRLALTPELRQEVASILVAPSRDDGWSAGLLAGLELDSGDLVLRDARQGFGGRVWRHDLPTLAEMAGTASAAPPGPEKPRETSTRDRGNDTVKQLVMANVGCVSILLGFLRNPKVIAVPGLVADVARRSRSIRVLEVIATDRALHCGFANKDVPRAVLESPVNVPVKSLRKFIHVKYVSRTDLKRMAQDKARLRKEIIGEIQAYLESLT
jgi:hypothetical protein